MSYQNQNAQRADHSGLLCQEEILQGVLNADQDALTVTLDGGTAGTPSGSVQSVQGVPHTFTSAAAQTITLGGTAQTVFAASTTRGYLFVLNTSDTIMYLDVTGAAATSAAIPLAANNGYYEPLVAPASAISILCATTGKTFVAKQA